jgi:hypothetical protein
MSSKKQKIKICLTMGLLLMCMTSSVNAVYIAGLDWLPFQYTLGLSWNDVQPMLQPGGILEGWRYATRPEIASLYTALHPGWVRDEWSTANKGITDAIGSALGYTTYNPDTEFRMIDAIAWPSGGASGVSIYRIIISDPYAPPDTEYAGLGHHFLMSEWLAFGRPVASFLIRDTENQPPVADASNTDTEVISSNGTDADVTLDGSLSYDPDGDPLTYFWSENGVEIAADEISVITLSVGDHTIGLSVDDGKGGTDYDEVTIGVISDRDGDGVPDDEDAFPDDPTEWADADGDGVGDNADQNDTSDLRETVVVGSFETGVANQVDAWGLSIQDYINEIEAEDYSNHGRYVCSVAHFVEDLLDAGLITEDEADFMMSCAAESKIGK